MIHKSIECYDQQSWAKTQGSSQILPLKWFKVLKFHNWTMYSTVLLLANHSNHHITTELMMVATGRYTGHNII
jgi:hypothetical protein